MSGDLSDYPKKGSNGGEKCAALMLATLFRLIGFMSRTDLWMRT